MSIKYEWEKIRLDNGADRVLIRFGDDRLRFYSLANRYLGLRVGNNRGIERTDEDYIHTVCHFLQYLYEKEDILFDTDAECLTFDHAQDYLDLYSTSPTKTGEEPSDAARKNVRGRISRFLLNLKKDGVCPELESHDIVYREKVGTRGNYRNYIYELSLYTNSSQPDVTVLRDSPKFFIDELLSQARIHDPDVYMLASLQIYGGLRPSEACNVRTQESLYGFGYQVTYRTDPDSDGLIAQSLSIDLKKKAFFRPLRSDGVFVGGIKKPRNVDIYPGFVQALTTILNNYVSSTRMRMREPMGPLVTTVSRVNGKNMAMTYKNYIYKFKMLCYDHVFPALREAGGIRALYAEKMMENHFGPHMLREYFSCELVRLGCSWSELMHYRGDKSERSAIIYILKGGVLSDVIDYTEQVISKDILSADIVEKMLDSRHKKDMLIKDNKEHDSDKTTGKILPNRL